LGACCSSSAAPARALTKAYREAGGPAAVNRREHFSMLIAQLGHITETAATDWLTPNSRSPHRADAAVWIGETLDGRLPANYSKRPWQPGGGAALH
jgi:hypothetical protein